MNKINLKSQSPEEYQNKLLHAIYDTAEELKVKGKQALRAGFDSAKTDYKAQSYIDVARMLGYTQLANEMEVDLFLELSKPAHDTESI